VGAIFSNEHFQIGFQFEIGTKTTRGKEGDAQHEDEVRKRNQLEE
jgi:hypothetical protein